MIKTPKPFEHCFLQKKDAIMLTSGPPNKMAGPKVVSTSPLLAADSTPEQMDAQTVLGKDRTKAMTPNTIGAAVFGFRMTISVVGFVSSFIFLCFLPVFFPKQDPGTSRFECRLRPDTK